jgi:ATP-dependent Clp protease adaptor protein ClpS
MTRSRAKVQPSTPRPDILVEEDVDVGGESELEKRYHLFLHDSDDHTYEYVIEMLGAVFGYGPEKSFAIASMIDGHGRGIVETADYNTVKGHQDQIHNWGPDPRIPHCKGSLSATIEEAA